MGIVDLIWDLWTLYGICRSNVRIILGPYMGVSGPYMGILDL